MSELCDGVRAVPQVHAFIDAVLPSRRPTSSYTI